MRYANVLLLLVGQLVLLSDNAPAADYVVMRTPSGSHQLKLENGEVYHRIVNSDKPYGKINEQTPNPIKNLYSVHGTGFADLNSIHVVAVDGSGVVWQTIRLESGVWEPWENVTSAVNLNGKASEVKTTSRQRTQYVFVRQGENWKAFVRDPDTKKWNNAERHPPIPKT